MTTLIKLTKDQTKRALDVDDKEFEYFRHPQASHLHDPFLYKDMRELVSYLHRFKKQQQDDPSLLLVVDTDYDTDGVMSAVVLTASLSVFGINHRVYIPSMAEGYGLSPDAIDNMKKDYEVDGYKIGMILTADNGTSAFTGIKYANKLKIPVLVTDHHLGGDKLPPALAIVNPNRPDDLYPFKGNAGACVAWKAMLAYATTYQEDALPLINHLIIFAGLANVADVMPVLDENRYIIKRAIEHINQWLPFQKSPAFEYTQLANTPYDGYNTVFYGLYDLIVLLQTSKDDARAKKDKSPIPLPTNEELFSWYLSPLLNAPRRVHETALESMVAFLLPDKQGRHYTIQTLIELNKEKSVLRDRVLEALDDADFKRDGTVLCVNTRKGITGLIAGSIQNATSYPAVVFSYDDETNRQVIFNAIPDTVERLTASARSNALYPLDRILYHINQRHPNLALGGGHVAAAGFNIKAKNYDLFCQTFYEVLPLVHEEVLTSTIDMGIPMVPANHIDIDIRNINSKGKMTAYFGAIPIGSKTGEIEFCEDEIDKTTLAQDILDIITYQDSLRPFGSEFDGETKFRLIFNDVVYDLHGWNPDFWKTFKFELYGVEVLTFDIAWADKVKQQLSQGETITANISFKTNTFRGVIKPQFILSASNE